MRKMKRAAWAILLAIPLLLMASCGTSNNDSTTGSEKTDMNVTTRLDLTKDGEGSFVIKNEAKEQVTLTMSSGQQIEYQLMNEAKETVYTYSANKMFIQGIQEKNLKPDEEWKIPLELQTELVDVPAGTYKLVAWSTAEGLEKQKEEATYEWTGKTPPETTGKLVVETQEVTYIGQADLHTIEVKNQEGTTEVMRLSEAAIPFFEGLEQGKQLIVEYVIENDQKVIQFARFAE